MAAFLEDYNFGVSEENKNLHKIKQYFNNDNIVSVDDRYSRYDYTDGINYYELKSRRCNYNKFPTTIIGQDKILNNSIFIFNFQDGMYYIKYDKEVFKKFNVNYFNREREGVYDKRKPYIFIPIKELIKM